MKSGSPWNRSKPALVGTMTSVSLSSSRGKNWCSPSVRRSHPIPPWCSFRIGERLSHTTYVVVTDEIPRISLIWKMAEPASACVTQHRYKTSLDRGALSRSDATVSGELPKFRPRGQKLETGAVASVPDRKSMPHFGKCPNADREDKRPPQENPRCSQGCNDPSQSAAQQHLRRAL